MKRYTLLLLILTSIQYCYAKHIVGGAFSLQHVNGNKYKLTLKVLRDCISGGASFDDPATVGVFEKNSHELIQTYRLNLVSEEVLNFAGSNCNNGIPNTCTSLGIYEQTIVLTPSTFNSNNGYYFSYQRCCRNNIITNIQDPEAAGIAIYMEIPPPRNLLNSTPYFKANPNTYLCVGNLTKYNLDFKDDDGDVLKYSFVNPLNGNLDQNTPASTEASSGPYPEITWFGAHSTNQQIIGTPSLSINASTGEISVNPLQTGVYVVAIRVEEFRQGIKLGEVRLELQFNVTDCPQAIPLITLRDTTGALIGNSLVIQTPQKICFDVEGTDLSDSLFMTIKNISADISIDVKPSFAGTKSGFKKISNRICWEASCDFLEPKTQQLMVELVDNGCPFAARSALPITLRTIQMPTTNPTDLLCMTLVEDKATLFYWGDSTGIQPYFRKYNIYRAIDAEPFVLLDSVTDKSLRAYFDQNTPQYAQMNYRYFMRAANLCGHEGPSSDTLGTFEQLKFIPDQQKLITATVFETNKVLITWPKTYEKDFARYLIYKKESAGKNYELVQTYTTVTDTVFIDTDVDVNNYSYCYHVVMKDTCDNYGPDGLEACTILLKGYSEPFKHHLNWTPYNFWETGAKNYTLQRLGNESPALKSMLAAPEDTTFIDDELDVKSGIFTYCIIANQANLYYFGEIPRLAFGYAQSQSNTIELMQKPHIHIPNAFTPNGDGINETWNIRDVYIKNYNVSVYNKWGQLIFKTDNKNTKWTGTSEDGDYQPTDVYIYRLIYTGYDESRYVCQGNVTIIR